MYVASAQREFKLYGARSALGIPNIWGERAARIKFFKFILRFRLRVALIGYRFRGRTLEQRLLRSHVWVVWDICVIYIIV